MIKSKKQMYIVVGVFLVVLMLGTVTYAFFNYTRTGSANTIRTGRIAFNSTQGNSINLTNMFPIDVTNGIPNDATKVGSVTINVTGDTTYDEGIEYLVSAVNVQNTVGSGANAKQLPISIEVSVANNTNNDPATTLGTADTDYFTNRGTSANTSIYKVLANDVIANNDQLVVGYIKSGATGVDGNIVIRAYLDASKVAISDTYPEQTVRTVITTGYSSSNCETVLTGVQDASTYCTTASSLQDAIDNEDLTSAQITLLVNAGIVEEYTNGTTSTWVGDRTVLTTSEWNSLQANGVNFQVKVESNEGIWIEEPIHPICRRVTNESELRTATCERTNGGCYATGYYVGGSKNTTTITYGNIWDGSSDLSAGDALDCDVNNDGVYDSVTERFYYVSSAYVGSTNTFDDTKAVLIYYTNVTLGISATQTNYAYATQADAQTIGTCTNSNGCNWYGPLTAYNQLPSVSNWSNNQIIAPMANRQITNENGGPTVWNGNNIIQPFTYGKAARIITGQELVAGCPTLSMVGNNINGEFDECIYLMDNIGRFEGTSGTYGYWLETPSASNSSSIWTVDGEYRKFYSDSAHSANYYGVRPAIEVLKSNIAN